MTTLATYPETAPSTEHYTLDPEIKAEWVKALLYGQHKQVRGQLYDRKGGYCALGVLNYLVPGGNRVCMDMPQWPYADIARMNDQDDLTFPEIAAWIQENL